MAKRKLGMIGVIIIGIIIVIAMLDTGEQKQDDRIFHVTLADPELYIGGVFSDEFVLEPGNYRLKFTPNGDSPKILSISVRGETALLEEDFELKGTAHTTEIAQYYTWEYLGQNTIYNTKVQKVQIIINPNGNLLGPVSVSLLKE